MRPALFKGFHIPLKKRSVPFDIPSLRAGRYPDLMAFGLKPQRKDNESGEGFFAKTVRVLSCAHLGMAEMVKCRPAVFQSPRVRGFRAAPLDAVWRFI